MSPTLSPLMLSYTGQACNSCYLIHPIYTKPHITTCRCETAIFCNATCEAKADHGEECELTRTILNHPLFDSVRFIGATKDPSEVSSRCELWRNRLLMAKFLVSMHTDDQQLEQAVKNRFLMEPFCNVCYGSMRNGNQGPSIRPCCTRCFMAFACKFHEDEVKKLHTEEECTTYCVLHDTQDFLREHIKQNGEEFSFIPEGKSFGENPQRDDWLAFLEWRVSKKVGNDIMSDASLLASVSRVLSVQLTTIFALKQHKVRIGKKLVVHVVGVSVHDGLPAPAWEELLHQHKNIKELYVVLVGPDLQMMTSASARDVDFPAAVCEYCPGRKRIYRLVGGLYHEFVKTKAYCKPDLVVAFNTGMGDAYVDSWEPTVKLLIDAAVPCFFTSWTEYEAEADEKVITGLGGKVLGGYKKNPYRCLEPIVEPDVMADNRFFFYNQFYMLVKGRK